MDASPSGPFTPGERIDPRWIADLIAEPGLPGESAPAWVRALKPVLNGMYTADNLDYVPRDIVEVVGRVHAVRSEEHTSELQSRLHLVCRLLLEKKNNVT